MTSTTRPSVAATPRPSAPLSLDSAAAVFTVAVLLHNADHLRRGTGHLGAGVFWLGTSALLAETAVVVLVVARHRLAPAAAAVVGGALAIGYSVVHFLPDLGWFSDSFTSAHHVSSLSWVAAVVEVLAALALAAIGALTGRRVRGTGPRPPARRWTTTARHPVAAAVVIGNAAVLTVSLLQR